MVARIRPAAVFAGMLPARNCVSASAAGDGTPIVDTECTRKHDVRYDMLMQPNDKIFVPECHWLTRPHFPIPQVDSVRE